jgi:flagellar hook protein FlgE
MMRSLFSGVSGLKVHQTRMDVIGNNIANVNTAGYKSSRVTFQEALSQMIRVGTAPTEQRGGTNPQQVGLGVQLGSIDVKHTQGNVQSTGYATDLAIEGDGFFIIQNGDSYLYTRAGMFGLDRGVSGEGDSTTAEGSLVSLVSGGRVMGYKADADGRIDPNSEIEPLSISAAEDIKAKATDTVVFAGNLDSRFETGKMVSRTIQTFDSLGREHTVIIDLQRQGANTWEWNARLAVTSDPIPADMTGPIQSNETYKIVSDGTGLKLQDDATPPTTYAEHVSGALWKISGTDYEFELSKELIPQDVIDNGGEIEVKTSMSERGLVLTADVRVPVDAKPPTPPVWKGTIEFNDDGSFLEVEPASTIKFQPARANEMTIKLDFTQFTQYANDFTGRFVSQNGYASGHLESFAIDTNGVIVGSFSNGLTRDLGRIALATFSNPGGLLRAGSTMFASTATSGTPNVGAAGTAGFGDIAPSSLEMSNVDLSEEFTEMIIAQRGFQANSRIITTSDEMMQELVNMKR